MREAWFICSSIISDIVYVATINPFHAEQCIRLMNAGKNVLCEKPMTMNLKEAKQVLEVAKKQNVLFVEVNDNSERCVATNTDN